MSRPLPRDLEVTLVARAGTIARARAIARWGAAGLLVTACLHPTVMGADGEPDALGNQAPRALQGRGLDNVVAFTRLLGYVRYFHPSDQAAATDWNRFAIDGVAAAEAASDPAMLARVLEDLFRPIAPSVRVFPTARARPSLPEELRPPAGAAPPRVIAWRHRGITDFNDSPYDLYHGSRVKSDDPPDPSLGVLWRTFDAAPYLGGRARLRCRAKAEVEGKGSEAVIILDVLGGKDQPSRVVEHQLIFSPASVDVPVTGREWREYAASAEVPRDAKEIRLTLYLKGYGRVTLDGVSIEPANLEPGVGQVLDFIEKPGIVPPDGWSMETAPHTSKFLVDIPDDCPSGAKHCVSLHQSPVEREPLPDPAAPFEAELEGGVSCLVPLALYMDATGTLPRPRAESAAKSEAGGGRPKGWEPSGNDRATRLAAVAIAWNAPQYFYPYFDAVDTDWTAALRRALESAATDVDEEAFLATLRRMIAKLHDGHGEVGHVKFPRRYGLPILWGWIEDRLVVTRVADTGAQGLKRGDVILSLNGRPTLDVLRAQEEEVSGATPAHVRRKALDRLASGTLDSSVTMQVVSDPSARPESGRSVTLGRTVPLFGKDILVDSRPASFTEVAPGILYVDTGAITSKDLAARMSDLANATDVIFDARSYPRIEPTDLLVHLTDVPLRPPLLSVPIGTRPDHRDMRFASVTWTLEPQRPRIRGRCVFLIDERDVSAGETFVGIVEAYHMGDLIGSNTAGTNGNVYTATQLPGDYQLLWTRMKVLKHDGSRLHGVGYAPNVPVSPTIRGTAEGRDEVLERAIELLRSRRSAALAQ